MGAERMGAGPIGATPLWAVRVGLTIVEGKEALEGRLLQWSGGLPAAAVTGAGC
jgi:hypothetical protein